MTRQMKLTYAARAAALLAAGITQREAASQLGLTPVQVHRLLQLDAAAPVEKAVKGRPTTVPLTPLDKVLLRRHRLCNKLHSLAMAVEKFLQDPEASPPAVTALHGLIARYQAERRVVLWPHAVRTAAVLTETEKAMHRGPKHLFQVASRSRSGNFMRVEGVDIPLTSGAIYSSDDMSLNQPYRFWDAALGRETVGRQTLITKDVRSLAFLQADACGRERDAYRLEDIADHMHNVVLAHGLPLAWIVERGPWKNTFIDGIKLPDGSRWGALADLFHLHHAFVSTGKAEVEGGFGPLQSRLSHQSTDIGAVRGEFETATKLMARANRGDAAALAYFWAMAECMDATATAMVEENNFLKSRQHLNGSTVSASELWAAEYVNSPLLDRDGWYFLPVKKQASVRAGMLELAADHYARTFRFSVHGSAGMPCLDNLYSVLVAFHPGRPHEGCHVFNACTDHRNRDGYAHGQLIGVADYEPDVPRLVIGGPADVETKKKRNAAVRAEYRTIIPAGTGPGTLKSIARDGLGMALELQRGGSIPEYPALEKTAAPAPATSSLRGTTPLKTENATLASSHSDRATRLAALETTAASYL